MRLAWKFTEAARVRLCGLAWRFRYDIPDDLGEHETADKVGMMFTAALDAVLDPGSPPDCLGWKMLGPLVEVGFDLRDDRVQEDVLDFLQSNVYAIRRVAN